MLTGGKPRCSRRSSINATAASGKGGSAGLVSARLTPLPPAVPVAQGLQFAHPPTMWSRSWWQRAPGRSPCPAEGPWGPELFGGGCGQYHTVLLGEPGLPPNKTSVCHRFGLFIAFWCSLLQHFILRSLVMLPCRVQLKCRLLLVYVFQLRSPNSL